MTEEPIEAVIARLKTKCDFGVQNDLSVVAVDPFIVSRLLDYVEGVRARIRELEEALIKIRGWREIDRETLSERLTAIEEICSAALNGEKAAPTYATPAAGKEP